MSAAPKNDIPGQEKASAQLRVALAQEGRQEYRVMIKYHDPAVLEITGRVRNPRAGLAVGEVTPEKIKALLRDPRIEYIELDQDLQLLDTVPWNVERTGASSAWNVTNGSGAKVAILDTGVGSHSDLVVAGGWNVIENNSNYADVNGHGTAVAGVLAATMNSNGIVGVSPGVDMHTVKILNGSSGQLSDAIAGIKWAIDNNMSIVVMSFGVDAPSQLLKEALQDAYDNGILLVAASGNEGRGAILYPAAYSTVIAVGATDENDILAGFSSYGLFQELVAPGVNITTTTLAGGYDTHQGTSMVAPHVAGVAALLKSHNQSLTNVQLRGKLRNDAQDLGNSGRDDEYGYGLVHVNLSSTNYTLTDRTYHYSIYNITGYGTDNESTTLWIDATGNIDDVVFSEGYYEIALGDYPARTIAVNENGTIRLLVGVLYDDEWSANGGSTTDGKVWKDTYYIKVKTDTSSQSGECWQWDSSTSDYDQCYFVNSATKTACDPYYCAVGVPCTVGGVASYHELTSGASRRKKEVQVITLTSPCGALSTGDNDYYIFDQKKTVCSGSSYVFQGRWGTNSGDWSTYSGTQSCGSGSSCDPDQDEYTCTTESCTPQSPCRRNEGQACDETDGPVTNDCYTGFTCTGGVCATPANETTDLVVVDVIPIQLLSNTDLVKGKKGYVVVSVLNNGSYTTTAEVGVEVSGTSLSITLDILPATTLGHSGYNASFVTSLNYSQLSPNQTKWFVFDFTPSSFGSVTLNASTIIRG